MSEVVLNTAICSCGAHQVFRDGLCQRCLLKKQWQTNTSVDSLGIFGFFKACIPLAFKNFKYGIPRIHLEIVWEVIRNVAGWKFYDRQIVIAAPRGISKTTLISKGIALYCAVFALKKYIVISSKTGRTAQKSLRWIKQMLGKSIIISIFGDLRPDAKGKRLEFDQIEGKWTSDIIILTNGVTIEAIGMGQQLRSAAEGEEANRVDLFIADDTETDENTRTPDRRESNEVWLFEVVIPSLDIDNGTLVFINTQTHSESILSKLLKSKGWRKKFYQIVRVRNDGVEESIWPEKFPMRVIEAIRTSYEDTGRLNSFYKEYYNLIRSERGFDEKWIRRYITCEAMLHAGRKWIRTLIQGEETPKTYNAVMSLGIDSSFSFSESADWTVMIPMATIHDGRVFEFPISRGRFTTYDDVVEGVTKRKGIIDEAIRLHEIYNFDIITVDTAGQQLGLYHLIKQEFEERYGGTVRIMEYNASKEKKAKLDRLVNFLQPRYEAGFIYHSQVTPEHDRELMSVGDTTDDILDAEFNGMIHAYRPEFIEYNPIMLPMSYQKAQLALSGSKRLATDWQVN